MTNKDLIKYLKKFPPDCEIILAKDEEGNSFSPLYEIEKRNYVSITTWEVEIIDEEGGSPCLVFWPIN